MFNVNAAGCGKGKSRDNKELIGRNSTTRFLVIVPSIELAKEYDPLGTAITSESTNNVKRQIYRAIDANTRVIIITQKAFTDFESKTLLCEHRTVLQDEHLEPFLMCKWKMNNHLEWVDVFSVCSSNKDGWYAVTLNPERAKQFIASADMLDNKQFIQDLLSTPQLIFTNKPTIEDDSALFRVISPEIYAGADSVHIACANFQCTRQYFLWSSLFNAEFRFTRHFEAYETSNLTIHFAQQRRNSKTHNRNDSSIRDAVTAYINSKCSNPVFVDNNYYDTEGGWERVKHNCHGVNEHRGKAHFAILSAINYDNLAAGFLMDIGRMTAQQVRASLIGEIAHQVIMRGALRENNSNECHVYLMESELAEYLVTIFVGCKAEVIPDTARPESEPALTSIERKKASLIRKNFPQLSKAPTKELLINPIWEMTNSNGVYLKQHRDSQIAIAVAQ